LAKKVTKKIPGGGTQFSHTIYAIFRAGKRSKSHFFCYFLY